MQAGDERVGHAADRHDHRHGHAALAGRSIGGADGRIRREIDVGVGEHHHVVLRAAECLHALPAARAGLVHVARDGRGADEAHGGNAGVRENRVHRHLVAVHHVEHARRQIRLGQQLGAEQRRRWILLRRFQDEGVAARDRERIHPHRHHRRKVERRDARHDAERLADGVAVDTGRHILGELAFRELGEPARELDHLEAAIHLAERVRQHLAVLARENLGELALAPLEQLAERKHDARARRDGLVPPRIGRVCGRCDRGVHDGLIRKRDTPRPLAGGGIEDVAPTIAGTLERGAADPVRERPSE